MSASLVAIIMGSKSDLSVVKPASEMLKKFGVAHEMRVMSAHRTPEALSAFLQKAPAAGVRVFIAAAGGAAHLAGAVAAQTTLPVIGIPVSSSKLSGFDALLSTVQMPPGMPVATVAVDGADNAALLAVAILAVSDKDLAAKLVAYRKELSDKVKAADAELVSA